MDELVKRVSEKTGIPEDKARTAVTAVIGFLKEKYPALSTQLESALAGGGLSGSLGDLASKAGGLFDKKTD